MAGWVREWGHGGARSGTCALQATRTWSPDCLHVLKMLPSVTLLPPPKASLKLIAARGMLNTTRPSALVSVALLVNQALLCS